MSDLNLEDEESNAMAMAVSSPEDELLDLEADYPPVEKLRFDDLLDDISNCGSSTSRGPDASRSPMTMREEMDLLKDDDDSSSGDVQEPKESAPSFVPPTAIRIPSQSVAKKRTCPPPTPPQQIGQSKQSNQKLFGELNFMADFDPTTSSRNQEKKKKRYHPIDGRRIRYADDFDDCDCLRPDCPGCHFPCKVCGDGRCGHQCRVSRKWLYESIEVEGTDVEFKNPQAVRRF